VKILVLAIAGGLGTIARYGVDVWVSGWTGRGAFPLATFLVNVSGCLLIGAIAALSGASLSPEWRDAAAVGFCGGYTTFSAYALQSVALARAGLWGWCALNMIGSNVVGVAAVWLGAFCARAGLLSSS